jgi:hypothetical protein
LKTVGNSAVPWAYKKAMIMVVKRVEMKVDSKVLKRVYHLVY